MRICLLADHSGTLDEGMRKTAFYFNRELSLRHTVKPLPAGGALSPASWGEVRGFKPDIIHYVPGPSIISFTIMKALKATSRAGTVISATHPAFYGIRGFGYSPYYALSSLFQVFVPLLKPDRLLVQATEAEKMFRRLGCRTEFLPGGVDTERFAPVSQQKKQELRRKYGITGDSFVILHCGSFRRWRNTDLLSRLQGNGRQVVVAGNCAKVEADAFTELERRGCTVWKHYIPDIHEVYQLADCYVFPTTDRRGSIDLPLSVLEAMSCNLPVISTRFGALPRAFTGGNGFFFAGTESEIIRAVEQVRSGDFDAGTREMVMPYNWQGIVRKLESIYEELI